MKSAFITGANRGIGLALVKNLALELNFKVYMGCRNIDNAINAIKENNLPNNVIPIQIDVSDEKSIIKAYETFLSLKEVDEEFFLLINNAGVGLDWKAYPMCEYIETFDIPYEMIETMFKINSFGPLFVSKHFSKSMIPGGRIVNVASASGEFWDRLADDARFAGYMSSKAALLMLNKKIAAAVKNIPIYCNAACPGHIKTRMGGTIGEPPEAGADSVLKAAFLDKNTDIPTGKYYRRGEYIPIDIHPYSLLNKTNSCFCHKVINFVLSPFSSFKNLKNKIKRLLIILNI